MNEGVRGWESPYSGVINSHAVVIIITFPFDLSIIFFPIIPKPVPPGVLLPPGHLGAKGIIIAPLVHIGVEVRDTATADLRDPAVADGGPHVAEVVGELVVLIAGHARGACGIHFELPLDIGLQGEAVVCGAGL